MPDESLLKQYLASSYRIHEACRTVVFHVGVRSAELAALLGARGLSSCAFLTAWNPGSRPLPREENDARAQALGRDVRAAGQDLLEGQGRSPDRDWCEESCLVLGIDRARAIALARRYGQVAFLFIDARGLPELVLCEEEPA